MTTTEQSRLAQLATQCQEDSQRWFPHVKASIPHHTLALCGEVGELANLIKKIERGDLSPEDARVRYDVAMELTDVFIYLLNLAGALNIDLDKSYQMKRAENEKRFGGRNGRQ